jgi:hypothetical protein
MYSKKKLIVDINHYDRLNLDKSNISDISLTKSKDAFSLDEDIDVDVKFSIQGNLREAFTEKNWTKAYNKNDNLFKLKYGVKLLSGGVRKREIGKPIDSYRKASIFWTRNPKLVNPMKKKRVWVQIAKNFEPFIRLTEEEVRQEFFDFEEKIIFKASELGTGKHKIGAEAFVSWQKHDYTEPFSTKSHAGEIEINIK